MAEQDATNEIHIVAKGGVYFTVFVASEDRLSIQSKGHFQQASLGRKKLAAKT